MEQNDVNEDFGENVIQSDVDNSLTPTTSENVEDKQEGTKQVLEKAGIIVEGEVIEGPPAMTPTQKQKEYKRKMTQKRLDALKKAREAKKLKKEQKLKAKAHGDTPLPPTTSKVAETDEERIERIVQARLAKSKPAPKQEKPKETEEQRIERLVQERLKKHTPAIDPAKQAKLERQAYFSKLMFGE